MMLWISIAVLVFVGVSIAPIRRYLDMKKLADQIKNEQFFIPVSSHSKVKRAAYALEGIGITYNGTTSKFLEWATHFQKVDLVIYGTKRQGNVVYSARHRSQIPKKYHSQFIEF